MLDLERLRELELRSCPFCGGEARLIKGWPGRQKIDRHEAFVRCTKCGCKTQTHVWNKFDHKYSEQKYAIEDWNRRANDEEIERLRADRDMLKGDAIKSFMDGIPHMCDRCFSFKRTINAVKLVKREILTLRNIMPPDSDGGCDKEEEG